SKFLWQGCCYEQLKLHNHGLAPVKLSFSLQFQADFVDIFEVRGTRRVKRGEFLPPAISRSEAVLSYRGLDGVVRRTRIQFTPPPRKLAASEAQFELSLQPQEDMTFCINMAFESGSAASASLTLSDREPCGLPYDRAVAQTASAMMEARSQFCDIYTSNEQFND